MGNRGFSRKSCTACHSRKVKCDIQLRARSGHRECSACKRRGEVCEWTKAAATTSSSPSSASLHKRQRQEVAVSSPEARVNRTTSSGGGRARVDSDTTDLAFLPWSTWPPQPPPDLHEFLTSFLTEEHYSQAGLHANAMADLEAFLSTDLIAIPTQSPVSPSLPSHDQTLDTRTIQIGHDTFYKSGHLLSEMLRAAPVPMDQISLSSTDKWRHSLSEAITCSDLLYVGRKREAEQVAMGLHQALSQITPQETCAESVLTMAVMFEVWPDMSFLSASSPPSSLAIDVKSVQAMTRGVESLLLNSHADVGTGDAVIEARARVSWYIYLLDAFDALDRGCEPFLSDALVEVLLPPGPSKELPEHWIAGAHKLSLIARHLTQHAFRAGLRGKHLPPAIVQEFHHQLHQWHADWERVVRKRIDTSSILPCDGFMSILYTHCCMRLESLSSPKFSALDGYVAFSQATCLATSAWAYLLTTLSEAPDDGQAILRLSRSAVGICFGCLFWGLTQAARAKKQGRAEDATALLEGSLRFMAVLEKNKQSERLKPLQDKASAL